LSSQDNAKHIKTKNKTKKIRRNKIMSSLQEFCEKEKGKIEQEAEQYRKEHDMKGFWISEKGENHFTVLDKEIREVDFGDGMRKVFRVKVNEKEELDWAVNPRNPIYKQLITRLSIGERSFVMLRTGEKQATRYEFLDKKTEEKPSQGGEQKQ